MLLVPTVVAPSLIHGLGLFAVWRVPKDTAVARVHHKFDRKLTPEQKANLPKPAQRFVERYGYLDLSNGWWYLNADDLRYMNHSATPNTRQEGESDVAAADIAAGEELTCDYYTFDADAARKLSPDLFKETPGMAP